MPLVDTLRETCQPRRPSAADFFAARPDLFDEVVEARQAGYTWPQIVDALEREYGMKLHARTLRDFMARQL